MCDMGAYEGVQVRPLYGTNLILNGDAEAAAGSPAGAFVGTPYWTKDTGEFTAVPYNSPNGFPAVPTDTVPSNHGYNMFAGGTTASSIAAQVIDIAGATAAIDAGAVHYTLAADLGGYLSQPDAATVEVTFLDDTVSTIGSPVTIGPVTAGQRNNFTKLLHVTTTGLVPVSARSLQVVIWQTGTSTYNDGYADNLLFVLAPPNGIFMPFLMR
jgi:hypothetical protein